MFAVKFPGFACCVHSFASEHPHFFARIIPFGFQMKCLPSADLERLGQQLFQVRE
jgi:hypothetical protein